MKRHPNECLRTWTGRLAGPGTLYDRYDDESMAPEKYTGGRPILTKEYSEYLKSLKEDQPVTTYKLTKEEMEEYLTKYKVKIQFTKDKITCCSQICTEISCPNFEKCKEEIIIVEEEEERHES